MSSQKLQGATRQLTAALLGSLLGLLPLNSMASTLPAPISQALRASGIQSQALSIAAIPLNGPGQATFINADQAMNPASTMKLITTYAALELLQPNYQWTTALHTDGSIRNGVLQGNLYLKGGGDPALTMERLWLLLRELRNQGVQQIQGDLVLENSYFRMPRETPFDDDGSNPYKPYLVGPDALLINFKSIRVVATAGSEGVRVSIEPPNDYIHISNQARLAAGGRCSAGLHFSLSKRPSNEADLVVSGNLGQGCSQETNIAALDHATYAAGSVRALWRELGGSFQGGNRMGNTPSSARLLASSQSPDLTSVIRDINKYSNNTMARQLFLSIGARYRMPGDTDDAASAWRVINQWLRGKGIRISSLVMENGSGLSRRERITAREMATILQHAWHSPYAAELIASLPLPAMDGTLRKRMRDTPVAGNAHLKTGTLSNVRALAGFSRDSAGNSWALVTILNHPNAGGKSAILDQIVQTLYRQPAGLSAR